MGKFMPPSATSLSNTVVQPCSMVLLQDIACERILLLLINVLLLLFLCNPPYLKEEIKGMQQGGKDR